MSLGPFRCAVLAEAGTSKCPSERAGRPLELWPGAAAAGTCGFSVSSAASAPGGRGGALASERSLLVWLREQEVLVLVAPACWWGIGVGPRPRAQLLSVLLVRTGSSCFSEVLTGGSACSHCPPEHSSGGRGEDWGLALMGERRGHSGPCPVPCVPIRNRKPLQEVHCSAAWTSSRALGGGDERRGTDAKKQVGASRQQRFGVRLTFVPFEGRTGVRGTPATWCAPRAGERVW